MMDNPPADQFAAEPSVQTSTSSAPHCQLGSFVISEEFSAMSEKHNEQV